jgi:hypothetical protein
MKPDSATDSNAKRPALEVTQAVESVVAGGGIEPPTQGFSVLSRPFSINPTPAHAHYLQGVAQSAAGPALGGSDSNLTPELTTARYVPAMVISQVTPVEHEPGRYWVPSSRPDHEPHLVDMDDNGRPGCSCEDAMARNRECRHIREVRAFLKSAT